VLATFEYHGGHEPKSDGGGLVEFDERGHLIRSSSAMDSAAKNELIRPYSLVVVPALDRIVSTNTSMHADRDTRTVQVWRLSDLKLLRTLVLPPGPRGSEQVLPGEPHLLADEKTVLVHTFSCATVSARSIASNSPVSLPIRSIRSQHAGETTKAKIASAFSFLASILSRWM